MNTSLVEILIGHPVTVVLGLTLFHFLWQAAVVGLVLAGVLGLLGNRSANLRYVVACCGLGWLAILPLVTASWIFAQGSHANLEIRVEDTLFSVPGRVYPTGEHDVTAQQAGTLQAVVSREGDRQIETPEVSGLPVEVERDQKSGMLSRPQTWLAAAVGLWVLGVLLLALRLLIGWSRVLRWRDECPRLENETLTRMVGRLAQRMSLPSEIPLLDSARSAVPAVVGWVKPAILFPAGLASGLSPGELEALLAHELAHIRRHDYLVNLIQSVIETLLFYHPAVWWISRRIREERENCCDDMAVAVCGSPLLFARALAHLEERRGVRNPLSLAANGGRLVRRIRRIVGAPEGPASRGPAGAMILVALLTLLAGGWISVAGALDSAPDPRGSSPQERSAVSGDPQEIPLLLSRDDAPSGHRVDEVVLRDSKTGLEQRVFPGIKLSVEHDGERLTESVAMKYSNVIPYSIIPARVAEQLKAHKILGTASIEFGEPPPANGSPAPPQVFDAEGNGSKVDTDPVLWIPGHLAFYGLNPTGQHRFQVRRIDEVDVGIGKPFGPIEVLVSDDENSDFGLLGSDWLAQIRGPHGEVAWHIAADGSLRLLPPPAGAAPQDRPLPPPPGAPPQVTVTSKPAGEGLPRPDREGVRVLATHQYNRAVRRSTGYLKVDGLNVPVDVGLEAQGASVRVYLTLMFDVVAIDSSSGEVQWKLDWNKTRPIWETVSIVELEGETPRLAVELLAARPRTAELARLYLDLKTGEEIELEPPAGAEEARATVPIQIVEQEKETIRRAQLSAAAQGRSATERVRELNAVPPGLLNLLNSSVTELETLVSASPVRYYLPTALEADQILFNLPEGSGVRAEFSGQQVEIESGTERTNVVITHGKLELIDAGGVIRAWASPDGGAEQLVVQCSESNGEFVLRMSARRIKADPEYPDPPVQAVLNVETGAPPNEEQPPHGAVRYEVQQEDSSVRMKMKWRYDVNRLVQEAAEAEGTTVEEWIRGQFNPAGAAAPPPPPPAAEEWGEVEPASGLATRLTLQTPDPRLGEPLLFRLEIGNFGEQPAVIDPQWFEPFRVLKALGPDDRPLAFVGSTPQTSGGDETLAPGEKRMLWEGVDAQSLYQLRRGNCQFFAAAIPQKGKGETRDSNRIAVALKAGEPTAFQVFEEKLLERLPPNWNLDMGIGAEQGERWRGVFLSHQPSSLKRDVTTIQVWFTDRPLDEDYQREERDAGQVVLSQPGKFSLGFLNVAAPPAVQDLWPAYLERIRQAAEGAFAEPAEEDLFISKPWLVRGRVTDTSGQPLGEVRVTAHCGMGTLHQTGIASTRADGTYELRFGPGVWMADGVMQQVAVLSVHREGFYETNLGRQGDRVAALQQPAGAASWGDIDPDSWILPGRPAEIDFVLEPAVSVRGVLIDPEGNRLANYRVSLTGESLPPASNALDQVRTDAEGNFEIANVPRRFDFQFLIEPPVAASPWLAWASPPLGWSVGETGTPELHFPFAGRQQQIPCRELRLVLSGEGAPWKKVLQLAGEQETQVNAANDSGMEICQLTLFGAAADSPH